MTITDVIEMARKAGGYDGHTSPPTDWDEGDFVISPEALLKFATLVRNEALEALEALKAEVESLRSDAQRYRWLREEGDEITVCECTDVEWIPVHPKNIDATIDAAMEADAHECFCDRQYKDANKLASCGDCPRDYIAGAWDARRKYIEEHSKMTDRISTHADGCWSWGRGHYECALKKIERDEALLRQALEALDVYREYDPDGGGVADKVAAALRERLGDIYQINDSVLTKENRNDQ